MPYFRVVNIERDELPIFYELFDTKVIKDYKVLQSKPLIIKKNGIKENSILYTMRISIDINHYKFKDNIRSKEYSKILG